MATYYLSPLSTILQVFNTSIGAAPLLSGGLVWTYAAGTSTPVATYTDITGSVPNSNPIQLNSAGQLPNVNIWQLGGQQIKVRISTNAGTVGSPVFGTQIGPTFDSISGINDFTLAGSALSNPASGMGADLVANAMRSYDIFATARAANPPVLLAGQTLTVDFEGGVTINDQLGGLFYWNATSTATDDGLNVITPTGLATGRYLRLNQYLTFFAVKPGVTSIASNTSVAADPDLSITLPASGTYMIDQWINDATGTSAGGLKGQMAFSGTSTNAYWSMTGAGTGVTNIGLTNFGTSAQFESAQSGVGSMLIEGVLQATSAGTVTFNWAQQGSNVTASVVGPGSWLRITRVSSSTGSFTPVTHTYTTVGSATETIPVGASYVEIEAFGGPAGGNVGTGTGCGALQGAGGGSGGYSHSKFSVASANGQTIIYLVGSPGTANGGNGSVSTASSGTFSFATMTANGGHGGTPGGSGTGGAGGTASGGNLTNTTGNAGSNGAGNGGTGLGGAGITGVNGNGSTGGHGGLNAADPGQPGTGNGKLIFKFT